MLGILLQVAEPINGMNDVVFGMRDVITIGGGILATATAYLTLKFSLSAKEKADETRFQNVEKKQEEDKLHIQNSKRAMKKDLISMIEKEALVTKNRIDSTQFDMKENQKSNNIEFKELNEKLNVIIGYVKK